MKHRGWLACVVACLLVTACDPSDPSLQGVRVQLRANGDIQWHVTLPDQQSTKATSLRSDPGRVIADLTKAGAHPGAPWSIDVEADTPWRQTLWVLMTAPEAAALSLRTAARDPWFVLDSFWHAASTSRTRSVPSRMHIAHTATGVQMTLASGEAPSEQAVGAFPTRARLKPSQRMARMTLALPAPVENPGGRTANTDSSDMAMFLAQTLKTYAITDVSVSASVPTTTATVLRVARMLRAGNARVWFEETTCPRPEPARDHTHVMVVRVSRDGLVRLYRPVAATHPTPSDALQFVGNFALQDLPLLRVAYAGVVAESRRLLALQAPDRTVAHLFAEPDTPWRCVHWTHTALTDAGCTTVAFRDPLDGVLTSVSVPDVARLLTRPWKPIGRALRIRLFRREFHRPAEQSYTLVKIDSTHAFTLPRGAAGVPTHPDYQATMAKIRRVLENKVPLASMTKIVTPPPKGEWVPYQDVIHMMRMARSLGLQGLDFEGPPLRGKAAPQDD